MPLHFRELRGWWSRQNFRSAFTRAGVRDLVPRLLLIAGAVLLAYVAYAYTSMFTSQRRLEHVWQQQQGSVPATTQAEQDASPLTKISIPKINLDVVVVDGTKNKQLAIAPGHLEGTPAPGETGNSVISAHRDTFFRHIYELQKGDKILVRRLGKTFTYEVTSKRIVQPDDMSVVKPTKDAQLTLLTCYPTYYIGPAPERLAVFSKLVQTSEARTAQAVPTSQ